MGKGAFGDGGSLHFSVMRVMKSARKTRLMQGG